MIIQHVVLCWQNVFAGKTPKKTTTPSVASDFGTVGYFHKSNAKTAVVLDILKLGYEVLIIDADVVLFKNPFPYFNCTSCDVHFQMDRDMYNRFVEVYLFSASTGRPIKG